MPTLVSSSSAPLRIRTDVGSSEEGVRDPSLEVFALESGGLLFLPPGVTVGLVVTLLDFWGVEEPCEVF